MKKFILLLVALGTLVGVAACSTQSAEASQYYVGIDINPSIEFIVDEEDLVVSYSLLNEDAEIIAADLDFIGMNVEDAMALFIEKATEAGYIDVASEENAVLITVLGDEDDEHVGELEENLQNRAKNDFARKNIMASVFTNDYTAEDLVAEANELGLSPGKLRMIKVAQSVDETLTIETARDMSVRELMQIIRAHHRTERLNTTEAQIQQKVEQRQALLKEHLAELEAHLRENEDLTEEEIAAILNDIEERSQERMNNWSSRRQGWVNRMRDRNMPPYNDSEDETEEDESTDESTNDTTDESTDESTNDTTDESTDESTTTA